MFAKHDDLRLIVSLSLHGDIRCHQPLRGRTDGPCGPRAPVQSVQGRGMGFTLRSPGLTWAVSTIFARAGRRREGGLSSTEERVT